MGFRVGRSTDHDSTKRARDATRRRATARGTSAHAKPSADDFERSFARHAGRDVRNVRGSPCGGRARGIPNRRRAVRVRAVRYEVRTRAMRRGFERRGREAPMGWVRVGARVAARARGRGRARGAIDARKFSPPSARESDANGDARRWKSADNQRGAWRWITAAQRALD